MIVLILFISETFVDLILTLFQLLLLVSPLFFLQFRH